jgi:hypothetical protein
MCGQVHPDVIARSLFHVKARGNIDKPAGVAILSCVRGGKRVGVRARSMLDLRQQTENTGLQRCAFEPARSLLGKNARQRTAMGKTKADFAPRVRAIRARRDAEPEQRARHSRVRPRKAHSRCPGAELCQTARYVRAAGFGA